MNKGLLSLIVTAIAWSWPNVLIRLLRTDFDIFTQSLYRYASASLFLFLVDICFARKLSKNVISNIKVLIIPAMIMTLHQIFFTAGLFKTPAVMSSLLGRLNAIFIPTLSCIFYEDERMIVKNRNFLIGTLIALSGVTGVIMGKGNSLEGEFNIGTVFVMLGTLFWSIYAVYIKKIVRSIDPLSIIFYVSLISTIFFVPIALKYGDVRSITRVSLDTKLILFGSGILGIGVGNLFYYHAVKHVGTSISSTFFLILPFTVGALAFIILGEMLTMIQMISGLISILGCWFVTMSSERLVRSIRLDGLPFQK